MTHPEGSAGGRLQRGLGLLDCALLVIGAIIGSGIFLTPSTIARTTQSVEANLAVWVLGGVLTFCGAVSFAELGAAFPEAGGIYVFLSKAYGPMTAFLYGWCVFFVIVPGSIATLATALGIYLSYLVPLPAPAIKGIGIAVILLFTGINCLGLRAGARTQNLLTLIKVAALLAIMVVLFSAGGGGRSDSASAAWSVPTLPSWSALGIAMIAVLWSYDGWHLLTFAAGEVKDPQRNLTGGLILGTLVVITLYQLVNLAYLSVLPLASIGSSSQVAGDAMELAVGPWGGTAVSIAILLSISGAMNGNVLAGPRVPYAMAEDRLFFRRASYIHPRYQVPTNAILLTGFLAGLLSLIGTFEQLFNYVIFVGWIFYGLGAAAVIVLRRKLPSLPRPYRTWGYPVAPLLFVIAAASLVLNSVVNDLANAIWGILVLIAGLPAYAFWKSKTD